MKSLKAIVLILGVQLAIVGSARAGIRSVKLTTTPASTPSGKIQILVVEIDACSNGFPSVAHSATKIDGNTALLELVPLPGVCAKPDSIARLTVIVEDDLADLGLDPETAKIFVQLQ